MLSKFKHNIIKKVSSNDALQNDCLDKLDKQTLGDLHVEYGEITKIMMDFLSDGYYANTKRNNYNFRVIDKTRVKLNSDIYINANHVRSGPNGTKFIAAEAPMTETINEFWAMVFQENVEHIIMLCEFVEDEIVKCAKYIPRGSTEKIGSYYIEVQRYNEVVFLEESTNLTIVEKVLQVTDTTTRAEKKVFHHQFKDWPDYGTPKNDKPLIYLYQHVVTLATKTSPILVHCAAGVGRTGTFIGAFFCYELFIKNELISMQKALQKLRGQRNCAVQTTEQYVLMHCLMIHLLRFKESNCNKIKLQDLEKKYFDMIQKCRLQAPKPIYFGRALSVPY